MRDNKWLEDKMWFLLENHFADVPVKNDIQISFGRRAKQRLGSIKRRESRKVVNVFSPFRQDKGESPSIITITGYFKDPKVPDFIVISTIAHELAHYAHGFSSPLEQRFEHPHLGGVVHKELEKRGLGEMQKEAKKWLRKNWRVYLRSSV